MYPQPEWPAFGTFVRREIESLRKQGVTVDVLFINGRRSKVSYASAFPRLWGQLLRTGPYDLLHAHYVLSGLVARAQWRLPVVLTHWGIEVFKTWQAPVCGLTTSWFDRLIVQSPAMKERLGVEDAHVIPAGVDLDRFTPMPIDEARRLIGLPLDKKLVVWAGEHFRPEKRFDIAEKAMGIVSEADRDAELVLLSGKPPDAVPAYLSACDALLLTSDAEGSPNVIKEAMASNLPIVSTAVGDVPEMIGGTAGCYLCSQEPHDVAEKVQAALAFGKRTDGRQAVRRLGLDETSKRIIGVYEEALA
jgi:teichuronic acid biosynthesis glycosyltransferase TuaC